MLLNRSPTHEYFHRHESILSFMILKLLNKESMLQLSPSN
jgi:hypothetical protein